MLKKIIFAIGATSILVVFPVLFIAPSTIYDNPSFFLSPGYIIVFSTSTFIIYKFLNQDKTTQTQPKFLAIFAIPFILAIIGICLFIYGIYKGVSGEGGLGYLLGIGMLIIFAFFSLIFYILIKRAVSNK